MVETKYDNWAFIRIKKIASLGKKDQIPTEIDL